MLQRLLQSIGSVLERNDAVLDASLDHAEIDGTRAVDGLESLLQNPRASVRADRLAFGTIGVTAERVPSAKVRVVDALARRESSSVRSGTAHGE